MSEESNDKMTARTVVKDLCFAAWVVQACARLRGAPSKEQALKMVEDYFSVDVEEPHPTKKAARPKAGKLDKERAEFLAWVAGQLGRELTPSELRSYTGKFNYHMGKGHDPYQITFNDKSKDSQGRKVNEEKLQWLARQEMLKGEPLTDQESATLNARWYRMKKAGTITDWDNRGRWPTCKLHDYETAMAIRVSLDGHSLDLALYRNHEQAKEMLPKVDAWLISLRAGRNPHDVLLEVGNHIITTPQ